MNVIPFDLIGGCRGSPEEIFRKFNHTLLVLFIFLN